MLFPAYKNQNFGHVNLEKEAIIWQKKNLRRSDPNVLLKPEKCQELIDEIHQKLGLAWSYGGWMEVRQNLWRESYLEESRNYLHLGVDFNVAESTEVALPWEAVVLRVDIDNDRDGGWGGRVLVRPTDKLKDDDVYIFAHLHDEIAVKVGDVLQAGEIIATVGKPDVNGGWFSHLHVQAIAKPYFDRMNEQDWDQLDGYGSSAKRMGLAVKFPDPLCGIKLT